MILALLTGCVRPDAEKPDESVPSADTHESAPDTGTETAADSDTGAETAADSDTDTGVVPADWNPGDEIPGWEDHDCTETGGAQAYETQFPSLFLFAGEFTGSTDGPQYASVILRDCVLFPCDATTYDDTLPYARVDLDGTYGPAPEARALGLWGPDELDPRHASGIGVGPMETWSDSGTFGSLGQVSVCISRMRPDQVQGAIRVEVAESASQLRELGGLYPSIIYRLPFSLTLEDHSGFDSTSPDAPDERPGTFDTAHFTYDVPYDSAWPWDDITDPGVRAAVYERYTPYNDP